MRVFNFRHMSKYPIELSRTVCMPKVQHLAYVFSRTKPNFIKEHIKGLTTLALISYNQMFQHMYLNIYIFKNTPLLCHSGCIDLTGITLHKQQQQQHGMLINAVFCPQYCIALPQYTKPNQCIQRSVKWISCCLINAVLVFMLLQNVRDNVPNASFCCFCCN